MGKEVQHVVVICERTRNGDFWSKLENADTAAQRPIKDEARERFWQVLGKLPVPDGPENVKARLIQETDKWTSYEITMDVFSPDVFAWGILMIPKGMKPGEKRPVVVCQHGLENVPADVVTTDSTAENYHYYHGLATRLTERGYITFCPHNPYKGGDRFRVIQREGNPLGLTLFSVIISQHQRILEWLRQQTFVDPERIGFYGLSYGGKSAMRIPAIVQGYALSICSADFNEWVRKVSATDYDFAYVYNGEYDMPEWDLGHTFNYAEMAALIAPRPFMVERGYYDGVAKDEWVNYEYAKVRRHYGILGLENLTRMESFPGPHTIHGKGTFEFLDAHLKR
jgi:cephalosporin-C deacetylase-like acetyl esterase